MTDRVVTRPESGKDADLDRRIDRLAAGRPWGYALMLGLLAVVMWITVTGANAPSQVLSSVLIDTLQPMLKE